ncbi:MAG: hypothetical protein C5S48_04570 [Candidatus Methanogaster sp.]|nr:MAG: hypothetical protein C5S48_04570 [ANME-2 cluster archaeon]
MGVESVDGTGITVWLLVIFVLMLFKRDIRKSLLEVIKAFFKIKILSSIFLMIAYTTGIVFVLYQINFWNTSLLKDTVVWFCFAGILMSFNLVTSDTDQNLFRKIIVNNIKIVIIIEFIVNTYTFSMVGELILILVVTFIVILEVVAKTDEKYSSVAKLMNGLQIIIWIVILIFAISNVVSDYKNFGSLDTLRNFLLAPLLTISFLPFIYLMILFATYELLFTRLNLGYEKNKKLKRYAKRKSIQHCLLSLKKVKKASNMNTYNLTYIRNEEDVDKMIKDLK